VQHEPLCNKDTRILTEHRLSICEQEQSHEEIERRIWFGQIEQLIEQAEDELDLTVAMNGQTQYAHISVGAADSWRALLGVCTIVADLGIQCEIA